MASIAAAAIGAAGSLAAASMGGDGGYDRRTTSPYTEEQRGLLEDIVGRTRKSLKGELEPAKYGGKDIIPEPTEAQRRAGTFAETTLGQQLPVMRSRAEGLMEPREWDPGASRKRWKQTVMQPARRQFHEEIAPSIMEQYAGRNALDSSAVGEALAESGEDVAKRGMAQLADMTYQDFQRHKARQLERAQLGQSLLGESLRQAGMAGDISGPLREIEERQRAEEYKQWEREQPWAGPWMSGKLDTALGMAPQRTSFVGQSPSPMSQAGMTLGSTLTQAGMNKWASGRPTGPGPNYFGGTANSAPNISGY